MQKLSLTVGATGATLVLSGIVLALAGPASAAAPTPSSTVAPSPSSSAPAAPTPASSAPPTARPSAPAAPIQVPAGNAGVRGTAGGASSLEIVGLLGAGLVLVGGGTVVAVRRRG